MITVCVQCSTEHVLKSSGNAQRKSLETHTENPQQQCLEYKGLRTWQFLQNIKLQLSNFVLFLHVSFPSCVASCFFCSKYLAATRSRTMADHFEIRRSKMWLHNFEKPLLGFFLYMLLFVQIWLYTSSKFVKSFCCTQRNRNTIDQTNTIVIVIVTIGQIMNLASYSVVVFLLMSSLKLYSKSPRIQ